MVDSIDFFQSKSDTSMVSLFARLSMYPSMNKQNKVTSVVVCNLCWKFGMDFDYIEHLLQFQKVPDDVRSRMTSYLVDSPLY